MAYQYGVDARYIKNIQKESKDIIQAINLYPRPNTTIPMCLSVYFFLFGTGVPEAPAGLELIM